MDEVSDYVHKRLRAGDSVKAIRDRLREHGHEQADVEAALSAAQESRRRRRMLYVLAVSVLVVAGVWFFSLHQPGAAPAAVEEASATDSVSAQELHDLASIADNASLCERITAAAQRENCLLQFTEPSGSEPSLDRRIYQAALLSQNGSACLNISDSALRSSCLQEFDVAESLPTSQERRVYDLAVFSGNESLCLLINESGLRADCQENI